MPTVILLDVSLSMTRPLLLSDGVETTRKQLAEIGINAFLDQLSIHSKLEFISLVSLILFYFKLLTLFLIATLSDCKICNNQQGIANIYFYF